MLFPMFLEVQGRLVVVIGGGTVGQRRARLLTAAGARVRLVCLEPAPGDWRTLATEWICAPYRPEHLDGAFLVLAAVSPSINQQVVHDSRERRILVNRADGEEADFQIPATICRGDLTVAISTGGSAPGLARRLRAEIEHRLDDSVGPWLQLLAELRHLLHHRVPDPARRRALLLLIAEDSWQQRFQQEGAEAVRQALLDLV